RHLDRPGCEDRNRRIFEAYVNLSTGEVRDHVLDALVESVHPAAVALGANALHDHVRFAAHPRVGLPPFAVSHRALVREARRLRRELLDPGAAMDMLARHGRLPAEDVSAFSLW